MSVGRSFGAARIAPASAAGRLIVHGVVSIASSRAIVSRTPDEPSRMPHSRLTFVGRTE